MDSTELTAGAVAIMLSGEASVDFHPVMQVADIRLVNTQNQKADRYRVLLSDGEFTQQGMLATQHNEMVKSEKLLKGSIIQLLQFVCNNIQDRMIVIIIDLHVILERCELIGVTKQYGNVAPVARTSSPGHPMIQPAISAGNPHSYNTGLSFSGSTPRPTMGGGAQVQPSGEDYNAGSHGYSSSFSGNMNPGRYNPSNTSPVYPKPEVGSGVPRAPLNNFARPPNYSYHQPSPMFANRGPIAKNEAPPRITPIAALHPYSGRWTIKARVTAKSELRQYNNARGDGKVFSFDLLDADGGEIRVTCFNLVADQFYHQIETGRLYIISRGQLKAAQKAFNHLRHDHEITLDNSSTVELCYEDDQSIPQQQFHFCPISDIEGLANNSVVDLIAVVSSINPPSSIMRKNGTETQKRTLQLKDMSGRSVELTLWGNFCNAEGQTLQTMCDSGIFPVLAVKAGRVNDFNGKSVGTISSSQLLIEPDFPEVQKLKTWFNSNGKSAPAIPLSTGVARTDARKTISQIKDEKLGTNEKPDWITVSATVSFIKPDNFCYTACPVMIDGRQCNKKVINNGDGTWRCEKCDKTVNECDYRYILQIQIQDHTGLTWVTAFQETGVQIMGRSAKELYLLKHGDEDERDEDKFLDLMHDVLFTKFLFKLKVKEEIFSDEQRVKSTVVNAEKINFQKETEYLLGLLAKSKEVDLGSLPPKSEVISRPGLTTEGIGESGESAEPPRAAAMNYSGISSYVGREGGNANMGQYGNQYGGSRFPSSGMYTSCGSCGNSTHSSANCPSLLTGPGQSNGTGVGNRAATPAASSVGGGGASADCFKCHQPGHWARDCPGVANAPPAYGNYNATPAYGSNTATSGATTGECYKCHQPGHWARDCPGVANNGAPGRYGMAPKQRVGGL